LNGKENVDKLNNPRTATLPEIRNEINGVKSITQRNEYTDGMTKKPPTAIAVRIKLKPMYE